MANLVLMIIFILAALGIFGYGIYRVIMMIRNPMPKTINYPNEVKKLIYLVGAIGVSAVSLFIFLSMFNGYPYTVGEWFELVFGSLLFGVGFSAFIYSFITHYWAKELPAKLKNILFYSILISALLSCVGLWLLTNSFADYLRYPLANGFSFTDGIVTPKSPVNPNIAFYAICILSGAILVYFICDHRLYVEYGKHGIVEGTFLIAFPSGIIGARIGYVLGEWNTQFANQPWWKIFAIWEGGLTIISGALTGIIVGVLWFITHQKKYNIWLAVDLIVPTILIAQAIGRWGNFFNCEVHGYQVSIETWRYLLPKIVLNNSTYSSVSGYALSGMIYLPLFYIESIINLLGYCVIRFLVGKTLRKYLELGDLAFLYISWYGLTRVIMEPLRDSNFNMGTNGYWSWFWSFVFVLGGILCIVGNHLVRYFIARKKGTLVTLKNSLLGGIISTSAFVLTSAAFTIVGAIMMSGSIQTERIAFNDYNNGLIILMIGLSIFSLIGISIPYIVQGLKSRKNEPQI